MVRVKLPHDNTHLFLRANTADIDVFYQVFIEEQYSFPFLDFTPEIIIDAGGFTGLSARYFALSYPDAQIVVIEPQSANYKMLIKNTEEIENISCIQAALWPQKANLEITNPLNEKWTYQVRESSSGIPGDIDTITIPDIISPEQNKKILLKIDIEGAEKELFESGFDSWLGDIDILAIELHDWFRAGCSTTFYKATSQYQFNQFIQSENIVLVKS